MKDEINTNKFLARIAMLTTYSFDNIKLKYNDESVNRIQPTDNYQSLNIDYSTADGLAHELAHVCFTPVNLYNYKRYCNKQTPLNAIEDYRIEQCLSKADKYLNNFIEASQDRDLNEFNNKADEQTKELMYIALQDKFKDKINIDAQAKKVIDEALQVIRNNPLDYYTTVQTYEALETLFKTEAKKDKGNGKDGNEEQSKEQSNGNNEQDKKEQEKEQSKEQERQQQERTNANDKNEVEELKASHRIGSRPSTIIEEYKQSTEAVKPISLESELKLIQKDLTDRKFNSNKGKLNTRRLGLVPNTTLFQQVEKRKHEQDLHILYDISGSMYKLNKYLIVLEFLKAVEKAKTSRLKLNYISFGTRATKELVKTQQEYIRLMQWYGNGTYIQTALELVLKDIRQTSRSTVILITDGESQDIDEQTVKQLESVASVVCLVICHTPKQLIDAGFSNVLVAKSTQDIPQQLAKALVKGK